MRTRSISHLTDGDVSRGLKTAAARESDATADLLLHIAEFDRRRLFAPAGYPSTFLYCVHELNLSRDSALKRIRAARTARRFPILFDAVAEGRLNVSGVILLRPWLTRGNAAELVALAARRTRDEIETLLADRFPRTEALALIEAVPERPASANGVAPGPLAPTAKVAPIAPERFSWHLTVAKATNQKLTYVQELLSHQIPTGDLAEVFDRILDLAIAQLEKRKFAATDRPRPARKTTSKRHVPAHVKRAVWERDGGRCTFVSETGQRCPSRRHLEYDHIQEVARGGKATVEGMRLRCRAHNQYTAECTFGAGFMEAKWQAAQQRAAAARGRARAAEQAHVIAEQEPTTAEPDPERDVAPWLGRLGFRGDEVKRAAAYCESITDASLEERVRAALTMLRPRCRTVPATP